MRWKSHLFPERGLGEVKHGRTGCYTLSGPENIADNLASPTAIAGNAIKLASLGAA